MALLGILAAIVVPQYQSQSQKAKESNAKSNLQILRQQIELYTTEHKGVPPGYVEGEVTDAATFCAQLTSYTDIDGNTNSKKTVDFPYGPYLEKFPTNPFNNKASVRIVNAGGPVAEVGSGYGWVYQPATRTIKLDWSGEDSKGILYPNY